MPKIIRILLSLREREPLQTGRARSILVGVLALACCLSVGACRGTPAPSGKPVLLSIEPSFSIGERLEVVLRMTTRLTGGLLGNRGSEVAASIEVTEVDDDGRIMGATAVIHRATIRTGGELRAIVPAGTTAEIRVAEGQVDVSASTVDLAGWEKRLLSTIGDVFGVHTEPRPDRTYRLGNYRGGEKWNIDSALYAKRLAASGFVPAGELPQGELQLVGSKTVDAQTCSHVEGAIKSVDLEQQVGKVAKKWTESLNQIEWCATSDGRVLEFRSEWTARMVGAEPGDKPVEYTDRSERLLTIRYGTQ